MLHPLRMNLIILDFNPFSVNKAVEKINRPLSIFYSFQIKKNNKRDNLFHLPFYHSLYFKLTNVFDAIIFNVIFKPQ